MKLVKRAVITGVTGYVPGYVLTNSELEQMVDTNDGWITTRTGIQERRILKGEEMGTSVMAIEAVKDLLQKTATDPAAIDLLICATITPDRITPATANIVAHAVGATHAFSYDLQAACSGFLYGLDTAAQFIASGRAKKVVVVGADKMSAITNYSDRATCILFGDGAGAVLVTADDPDSGCGIVDTICKADGAGQNLLYQKAGGSRLPASHKTVDAKAHYIYQDGQNVFKAAVTAMSEVVMEIMAGNQLTPADIAYLVPHQANRRILKLVADRAAIPMEKVMLNINKYGNTTAATIPLCLWDYEQKLKKGDKLIVTVFGGGFTWGAMYMVWGYDGGKAV
ncbi:MAG: ketoacyl-ACP synthase III [Candidatus Cardinium sp.]|uniref:beta-ketoacyl-ACP synthase III n=1 Tax=Cardinium endosymbiont of Dermatophagoides farinae TaxID=2597823 RepID=UPI001181D059|nr:beta-ketoacyl-ACP synthase III [Cardinium endosymbiont of Dermatophagoides farinae]TSJ80585.1 ketoacyl-ACP synthase III [Cardinium endosymbiont of Dermatophagoides farinae]UWW96573.1 MAG: ketoacyl-ACP synthase III [Candidatus Cardinium sp.]